MNAAQERRQIIRNAEAAYKRNEISEAALLWLRIVTAKYLPKNRVKCTKKGTK